jgi:hypothetical protein
MTGQRFALVRIDNSKFSEQYSEPIMKADTLEELEMKLSVKTANSAEQDDLFDFGGWGL